MESTLVESPEQYEAKLANDNQEFAEREEERKGLLARLTSKENLKIQFEKVLEFVTQEYENFSKVREAHRQSKYKYFFLTYCDIRIFLWNRIDSFAP